MTAYKKGKWRKCLAINKKFFCVRLQAYTEVKLGIIESRQTSRGGRIHRLSQKAAARINKNLTPPPKKR